MPSTSPLDGVSRILGPSQTLKRPELLCIFFNTSAEPRTKLSKWNEQLSQTTTGSIVWEGSLFISYAS